jgi:hypothetical protein
MSRQDKERFALCCLCLEVVSEDEQSAHERYGDTHLKVAVKSSGTKRFVKWLAILAKPLSV